MFSTVQTFNGEILY